MAERAQVSVKGVVQGVGFRPFVHRLATELGLQGYVTNTAEGVLIDLEGGRLPEFLARLSKEAPPLSRITDITIRRAPLRGYAGFSILASRDQADAFTLVAPDTSLCGDCLRELLDPADRRYLYPFINCTNCGPRYSITRRVPYDRPNTTMAAFTMCPDCEREYHDPGDRRFHAQPNACPKCGPQLQFKVQNARFRTEEPDPIKAAITVLRQGGILAIKGLGGFHIACDASNDDAAGRLRERKRKSNKPFALMFPSADAITNVCTVSDAEGKLLVSLQRPIVLLEKKGGADRSIYSSSAPHVRHLGCMLPYTPLHALLFLHPSADDAYPALVMTSGNLAEEPIIHRNDEAIARLEGIVDAFLFHDRDIFMREDDSVVRIPNAECELRNESGPPDSSGFPIPDSAFVFIRRSRGFAPDPIPLGSDGPEVLGCGADLKNTFTLTKGSFAVPSQHIGDMENYETLRFYEETLANLKQVYRVEPVAIAHDLHPGYLSTKWALERSVRPKIGIQHHYAHIGSVMAEHGLTGTVIGIAFDGTGYGTDGNLWGGEFLLAGIDGFERAGQCRYVRLPGGEAAIREPWRTAVSYIADAFRADAPDALSQAGLFDRYGREAVMAVLQVRGIPDVSPLASGAGRLFDAVSALLGLCDRNTFEGEAAMSLEAAAAEGEHGAYDVEFGGEKGYTVLDFSPAIRSIVSDLRSGVDRGVVSSRFHAAVANAACGAAADISGRTGVRDVALSGGTFQNGHLLRRLCGLLEQKGLRPYWNTKVPANDGGISLGQAYLVRERLRKNGMRNPERGR